MSSIPPASGTYARQNDAATRAAAERAYTKLVPRISELQARRVGTALPGVDLELAAHTALGVEERLRDGDRPVRIQTLARAGFVRIALIEGLRDVALACLHVAQRAPSGPTTPVMPTALRLQGLECRKRMRSVLEGALRGTSERELLRNLRAGAGDLALANDLLGYARLYAERRADLQRDAPDARPSDEALGRKLGLEIRRHCRDEADDVWAAIRPAALAMLLEHYAEATRVGRFLDHDDVVFYPTLAPPVSRFA